MGTETNVSILRTHMPDDNKDGDEGEKPETGFVKEIRKQSADFPRWYNDVVRKA